jgi:phosphoribosylaminoimidazolecarboxamide formyltransferase / IMP cyclohydrolase
MARINKALLSVSDKSCIVDFARELAKFNVQFISTGGTAKILREQGISLLEVSDYIGFPEMMDGRVKTLHPKIHGGLLGLRSNPEHLREMNENNIESIDMIVVNVQPFESLMNSPEYSIEEIMNGIDIGGIALIRSAAKNFESVTVVTDSDDYRILIEHMRENDGVVSKEINLKLAAKVFETTSRYDKLITEYLKPHLERTMKSYVEIPR